MRTCVVLLVITAICAGYVSADESIRGEMPLDHSSLGEANVEVNLSGSLFKFVAAAVGEEDPSLAQFLMGLKSLRVRVYGGEVDSEGHPREVKDILGRFKAKLSNEGWEILARIRETDSDVGVYVLAEEETIAGLFVVVSEAQQLVLVNIVGDIDLTQVSKIGQVAGLDLELPDLDPTKPKPTKQQQEQIEKHREDAMESLRSGRVDDAIAQLKQIPMIDGDTPQDFALLALLHQLEGQEDAAYFYVGRAYEAQRNNSFARMLYEHAKRLNPDNPLVRGKF